MSDSQLSASFSYCITWFQDSQPFLPTAHCDTWWPVSRATQNAINLNWMNHKVLWNRFSSVFPVLVCKFQIYHCADTPNSNRTEIQTDTQTTHLKHAVYTKIKITSQRLHTEGKPGLSTSSCRERKQLTLHCECVLKIWEFVNFLYIVSNNCNRVVWKQPALYVRNGKLCEDALVDFYWTDYMRTKCWQCLSLLK